MTAAKRKSRRDQLKVTVGPFRNLADYESCVEIQREVWRFADIDIIPVPLLLILDHCGGINIGAYNSLGELIGFACSMLGREKGEVVHHSHMLAVRIAYRNFDVGFKLKAAQRKAALKHKVQTVTWTFDPMQPLNAYFNLGKLGAYTTSYQANFYGETTSVLHRGLPTDRFWTRWDLSSKRVRERLEAGPPRHDLRRELKKYAVINRLEDVAPGMKRSSPVQMHCQDGQLLFEIPYNLPDIKGRNLGVALEWQGKMRQVFRSYLRKGYRATDFWVAEDEGHLRAFYFLEKLKKE